MWERLFREEIITIYYNSVCVCVCFKEIMKYKKYTTSKLIYYRIKEYLF